MALPANWGTGLVEGKYIKLDGTPDSGSVTFTANATRLSNASEEVIILPTQLVATLDSNGAFSKAIPSTNDADTNPLGFTYTVSENLVSGKGATYPIAVPQGVTTKLYNAMVLDPGSGIYIPGSPAPSVEIFRQNVSADITGITIDTLNLDGIAGMTNIAVPDYSVSVNLEAVLSFSHSVANVSIAVCIGPAAATIVTGLLDAKFNCLTTIGNKGSGRAFCTLPPHSAGNYSCFVCGDAGTLAIRAQTYQKNFFRAYT